MYNRQSLETQACCTVVQGCPLIVPKVYSSSKAAANQYFERMGYQKTQDPKTGKEGFETADRYTQRLGGCVAFYAAVMASERWPPQAPLGINSAWQYMARYACAVRQAVFVLSWRLSSSHCRRLAVLGCIWPDMHLQ